jgi:hypothetical protein
MSSRAKTRSWIESLTIVRRYQNFEEKILVTRLDCNGRFNRRNHKSGFKSFVKLLKRIRDIEHEISISEMYLRTSRDESHRIVMAHSFLMGIP